MEQQLEANCFNSVPFDRLSRSDDATLVLEQLEHRPLLSSFIETPFKAVFTLVSSESALGGIFVSELKTDSV